MTHAKTLLPALCLVLSLGLLSACSGGAQPSGKSPGQLETLDMGAVEKPWTWAPWKSTSPPIRAAR